MANRSAWAGGSLPGVGAFTPAFNAADLASLPQLSSVLSGIAFDNTVATLVTPDQFMDVSFVGAFTAAQTVASGAGIGLWLYTLAHDNVTYGGGRLVAGTQLAFSPLINSLGGIPVEPATGVTTFAGSTLGLTIPPRAFRLALQNQTGFAFAATGCSCSISTYRQATNA
ncbi:MAG TPA: hypothetical protein VK777_02015 [Reyranella sp.]|nr:hypothetical protein [Reyranella sp.]